MYLMFELRRLDVWPVDDLGVRRGDHRWPAWRLPTSPTAKELEPLGERFQAVPLGRRPPLLLGRRRDDPPRGDAVTSRHTGGRRCAGRGSAMPVTCDCAVSPPSTTST